MFDVEKIIDDHGAIWMTSKDPRDRAFELAAQLALASEEHGSATAEQVIELMMVSMQYGMEAMAKELSGKGIA